LTGNECGCLAGKKRDSGSDLTWMRKSPHGHPAQIPGLAFAALRIVRAKQLRFGRAWRDGIRGDTVGRENSLFWPRVGHEFSPPVRSISCSLIFQKYMPRGPDRPSSGHTLVGANLKGFDWIHKSEITGAGLKHSGETRIRQIAAINPTREVNEHAATECTSKR
jgi:hypothetical protein